jgi:2-deoxy-D-gluconate 3-dehydrogenase
MTDAGSTNGVPGATPLRDLFDLSGRHALVTGGGKGIGAAICRRLAEAGAVVTVADLDAAAGEDVAGEIGGTFVGCDITDAESVVAAVANANGGGAGIDICVNNAGIYPTTGPLTDVSDEFVARMLDVNVRAQFSVTREVVKEMPNGGAIVNLASIAGLSGGAGISAYAASKGAVIAMTRAFAKELGPRSIRVNAIAPGVIETPGVADQMAPLKEAGIDIASVVAGNPLRIAGQPDHIARAALFLASDLAAFVTGQTLVVDGGAIN